MITIVLGSIAFATFGTLGFTTTRALILKKQHNQYIPEAERFENVISNQLKRLES